ncbi:MAG: alpha-L-arabinofuranosidase [Candidatus Viridilinea halotolerans]|uniref:Alpha-L-arabinofuranosidase n=1 Tax=Candidatus Viridilinea halotolerans TaxID=2491704 RepID=A0A426TR71_9CHLR|nr:MAG: alpha-L-arabinofuranosidase [Candidatus Viridilinea halotolerans]
MTNGPVQALDARLLGTNVPAWLGPERLAREELRQRVVDLGPTLLRLPGGSWSNHYDWQACEEGQEGCYWPWAARPSDFLGLLQATGQEAIWTVSFNGTAAEAAALVAFFNGSMDDERPLGVDVRGRDWHTVGHWARLRAAHGHPDPYPIRLWEVGNEIYGAVGSTGPNCAAFGWEEVWTCDAEEYVRGRGEGTARREGYLEFRAAMRAVDPTILVGAVGVEYPDDWGGWGRKVMQAAGDDLDFYVVHHYGFNNRDTLRAEDALRIPSEVWPAMVGALHRAMDEHLGRRVPLAVTEYNLVAFLELDDPNLMRRAVNGLYLADTLGQMAQQGVQIANQWNLANGVGSNGADYGLVDQNSLQPTAQYFALALWQQMGRELLPVAHPFAVADELSLYAGRDEHGAYTLLAINKSAQPLTAYVELAGQTGSFRLERSTLVAESLMSEQVSYNGTLNTLEAALRAGPEQLGTVGALSEQTFAPYGVTLLRFGP